MKKVHPETAGAPAGQRGADGGSPPIGRSQANDDVSVKIASLTDWRGERLSRIRRVIRQVIPDVVEEVKWRKATNPLGVPTWSYHGIICTGESYKDKVKLTFMNGAALADPHALFTDEATGTRRAIDMRQEDALNEPALAALIKEATRYNRKRSGSS